MYKPSDIISFFKKEKTRPKKRLSQNFLIDKNTIKKIIHYSNILENDTILEIGPGLGALTKNIPSKNIIAIEKDPLFSKYLKTLNIKIIEDDFLKFPLETLNLKKAKVLANLPYNISTPIITKLLENSNLFSDIIIMVQYELAKRITSKENSKDYSAFTIFVNFYSTPKYLFKISKNCFFPKPKVDSAIIHLKIKKNIEYEFSKDFHEFTRKTFQKRRKKLQTSLKEFYPLKKIEKTFLELNIDKNARPENLSFQKFYSLFKILAF